MPIYKSEAIALRGLERRRLSGSTGVSLHQPFLLLGALGEPSPSLNPASSSSTGITVF